MEEYLAINHMQRKLSTANPIHGALLGVAQVANENAKLLLTNPSAPQTISGQNLTLAADLAINGGDLTTSATTFNLLNTTATTVNFAGAATTLAIGAATGTATIKNASVVLDGDLQVKGGDITTTATTFNLLNTTATTVNFAGAATALNVGAAAGTVTVAGDLAVNGGDLTTSATTFNLLASPTTVNIGAAATTLNLGAATGTATIKNASVVLDGDLQVKGGDITTTATTFGLVDTTATTVNFAGAAATLNIAESVTANQTVNVATGTTASASTKTINIGTGGLAGSTTTVSVGASSGTSTVKLNGTINAYGQLQMNNNSIGQVNNIQIADPGTREGIEWLGGSEWAIYESPDNLSNAAGNLQFTRNISNVDTRLMTLDTTGNLALPTGIVQHNGMRSYGSSGGSGSTTNYYAPVVIVGITATFSAVSLTLSVSGNGNSGSSSEAESAIVRLRVKQQNAMGSSTFVDVEVAAVTGDLWDTDSFVFVQTSNTVGLTEGTLYVQTKYSYSSITATILEQSVGTSGSYTVCSSTTSPTNALVAALPAGTQTKTSTMYVASSTELRMYSGSAERMRITPAGNVGIGTTSPSAPLHINAPVTAADQTQFTITDGTTGGYFSVLEGTSTGSAYLPMLRGRSTGINGVGVLLQGVIPSANDVLSTSLGAVTIVGYNDTAGTLGTLSASNVFTVRNNAAVLASIAANGNFAVDTNTLYVDAVNNRVGIGTTSPGETFHVVGLSRFDKSSAGAYPNLRLRSANDAYASTWALGQAPASNNFMVAYSGGTSWSDYLTFTTAGNIGIGVSNPGAKLEFVNTNAAFDTSTPGTTTYATHFRSGATDDYATGITWAGNKGTQTDAHAGIYVQSSGNYGTKMYFATTNSFATGAQTAMTIDHRRYVGVGTAPSHQLHVNQIHTNYGSGNITTKFEASISPTSTNPNTQYGVYNTLTMNDNATGGGRALYSIVQHRGASNTGVLSGGLFGIDNNDAGTMGSTISDAVAIYALTPSQNALGGAITNSYGLYVQAQSGTNITNPYGIYQVGAGDKNILAGKVRIGSTSNPTNALDVTGSATVSDSLTVNGDLKQAAGTSAAVTTKVITTTLSSTTLTAVDTYTTVAAGPYAAEYTIAALHPTSARRVMLRLMIMYAGTNVSIVEYGRVAVSTDASELDLAFSASISGSTVTLSAVSTQGGVGGNVQITMERKLIVIAA